MFTDMMINSLEKKGYMVLTEEEQEKFDAMDDELVILRKEKNKLTKKYNNLLKTSVTNMTIKEMREALASNGVTELPNKKLN